MNGRDFDYYIAAASNMAVPEGLEEYTVSCLHLGNFHLHRP